MEYYLYKIIGGELQWIKTHRIKTKRTIKIIIMTRTKTGTITTETMITVTTTEITKDNIHSWSSNKNCSNSFLTDYFLLYTISPSIIVYSVFVKVSIGLPSKIAISASLPTSILPTLSATPQISAAFIVMAL